MRWFAIEGNRQHLDGGAMFGHVPKTLWSQWITPDENNRIPLACRCLLVQTDRGKNILFEVGIGAFFEPKLKERFGVIEKEHQLLHHLALMGLSEKDIDAVVLSHLHFDHAGGLLPEYGQPPRLLFPKATYYLGRKHWEYAERPHLREHASFVPLIRELLEKSQRLVLIEESKHPDFDFGLRFHFSDGHTIGLMLSEIETDVGPLVFVSDLVPGLAWAHLPITMGYDRYPELKIDEKKRLFESLIQRGGRLFFTHDPSVSAALLQQDSSGRYIAVPLS